MQACIQHPSPVRPFYMLSNISQASKITFSAGWLKFVGTENTGSLEELPCGIFPLVQNYYTTFMGKFRKKRMLRLLYKRGSISLFYNL